MLLTCFLIYSVIAASWMTMHRLIIRKTVGLGPDAYPPTIGLTYMWLMGWLIFPVYLYMFYNGEFRPKNYMGAVQPYRE